MALLKTAVARGLLAALRVQQGAPLGSITSLQLRSFGDASYLDKKEVTDRVLAVVSGFDKVDSGKVRRTGGGPHITRCCRRVSVVGMAACGRGRGGAGSCWMPARQVLMHS